MLCAACNLHADSRFFRALVNRIYRFFKVCRALLFFLRHNRLNLLEYIGIRIFEAQVFQLAFYALHTEPVRKRCPDVNYFGGNQPAAFFVNAL